MKHSVFRIAVVSTSIIAMAGCATQPGANRAQPYSPLCALVGGAAAGGTAAALSAAAGPIGAAAFAGIMLGALACTQGTTDVAPVAIAANPPTPAPAPVVAPPVVAAVDLDSDGDGVVDRLDRCPDTPRGTKVNANGCPDILLTLTGVNFKFDSSVIEPASVRILDEAVATLGKVTDVDVTIVGHTDSVGTEDYNMALSGRRAQAVLSYLLEHGTTAARLTAQGRGEAEPIASNDTADGRYRNRRVELRVDGAEPVAAGAEGTDTATSGESWRKLDAPAMQQ